MLLVNNGILASIGILVGLFVGLFEMSVYLFAYLSIGLRIYDLAAKAAYEGFS